MVPSLGHPVYTAYLKRVTRSNSENVGEIKIKFKGFLFFFLMKLGQYRLSVRPLYGAKTEFSRYIHKLTSRMDIMYPNVLQG